MIVLFNQFLFFSDNELVTISKQIEYKYITILLKINDYKNSKMNLYLQVEINIFT